MRVHHADIASRAEVSEATACGCPAGLSVVGCDGIPRGEFTEPAGSVVRRPARTGR